jgi:hypothetical protein
LLPYAGQLVAERDRLGQLARRRVLPAESERLITVPVPRMIARRLPRSACLRAHAVDRHWRRPYARGAAAVAIVTAQDWRPAAMLARRILTAGPAWSGRRGAGCQSCRGCGQDGIGQRKSGGNPASARRRRRRLSGPRLPAEWEQWDSRRCPDNLPLSWANLIESPRTCSSLAAASVASTGPPLSLLELHVAVIPARLSGDR